MIEAESKDGSSEPLTYQLDITMSLLPFNQREQQRLRSLRRDYQVGHDFLGAPEIARLRFIRWLYCIGRLVP
jgi:hypothetical protein